MSTVQGTKTSPVTLIRVTAGVGKTSYVAKCIQDRVAADPETCVHVFTDTIKLCQEFEAALLSIDPSISVLIAKGREKAGCLRPEVIELASERGLPVHATCCDAQSTATLAASADLPAIPLTMTRCPHFDECPVQLRYSKKYQVYIFPHQLLVPDLDRRIAKPDLVIIDESFILKCLKSRTLPPSDLKDMPGGSAILETLRSERHLTRSRLLDEAVTPEALREFASSLKQPWQNSAFCIRPGDPNLMSRLTYAKPISGVAKLCETLASEMEAGREELYCLTVRDVWETLVKDGREKREKLERVVLRWKEDIKLTAPTLMLDATGDENLLQVLFPHLQSVAIDVTRNAHVVQIYDNMMSKGGFDWNAEKLLDRVQRAIELFSGRCRTGIVISYKSIEEDIKLPAGWCVDHFGNIRGRNDLKNFDCVVVVGRNHPPFDAIEDWGAALVASSPITIDFETMEEKEVGYRFKAGRRAGIAIKTWKDPILNSLLQQVCEHETVQAIDRLRAVRSGTEKLIVLLCDRPVDVEVDAVVPLSALARSSRLDQAQDQFGPVLPLRDRWLVDKFPALFGSVDAAKREIRKDREVMGAVSLSSILSETAPIKIHYRIDGQRGPKSSTARIRDEADILKIMQRLRAIHGSKITLYAKRLSTTTKPIPDWLLNASGVYFYEVDYEE